MKRARLSDIPAVADFLKTRIARAMFPLSNLDRFGLDGDHKYSQSVWFAQKNGVVSDVLCLSRSGMVMPALPSRDFATAASILNGRGIEGFIGPAEEVRPLIAACNMQDTRCNLDDDEPHFELSLDALIVPEGEGDLHPLSVADRDQMIEWRTDYGALLGMTPDRAAREALEDYESYLRAGSHRVLMSGGRALATTGFNAQVLDVVQVGGVYTPAALRGNGHARRAVALHLQEARNAGAKTATLFSASEAAARAYRAIGFKEIGLWTLCLYPEKVTCNV